jgi:Ca-activated chloride channel family protein
MYRMPRALSAAVKAALAALVLASVCAPQSADIRVNVNLVRVLTTVRDANGQLVGSLSKEDFTILDNRAPQQVAVFEHHTEQPLSVALLVDTSGSTAKDLKY